MIAIKRVFPVSQFTRKTGNGQFIISNVGKSSSIKTITIMTDALGTAIQDSHSKVMALSSQRRSSW